MLCCFGVQVSKHTRQKSIYPSRPKQCFPCSSPCVVKRHSPFYSDLAMEAALGQHSLDQSVCLYFQISSSIRNTAFHISFGDPSSMEIEIRFRRFRNIEIGLGIPEAPIVRCSWTGPPPRRLACSPVEPPTARMLNVLADCVHALARQRSAASSLGDFMPGGSENRQSQPPIAGIQPCLLGSVALFNLAAWSRAAHVHAHTDRRCGDPPAHAFPLQTGRVL